jgi:DNA repair protein RecO (recombination protein O)
MEYWEDQGIVLSARPHGETAVIVRVMTENHGMSAGYVRGGQGRSQRGTLDAGNSVLLRWQARVSDQLGSFDVELVSSPAAYILQDAVRLAALQSACALCEAALPERAIHAGVFHGLSALMQALSGPHWGEVYVMWELALLREMGFALDLTACAAGGDGADLAYVSPRTGRAVSAVNGAPYADKLLKLPEFLKPSRGQADDDLVTGLRLSGYFLEHWAFAHHSAGLPDARTRLVKRLSAV